MKCVLLIFIIAFCSSPLYSEKILFDRTKGETLGNADWTIDDNEPIPLPKTPQKEDDWCGALSSWAFELFKQGHIVTTLGSGNTITYNIPGNPYDLKNYNLFIVPEPQYNFSSDEISAILNFVSADGGLFILGNSIGSDRNGDGIDASQVWNNFGIHSNFGIEFNTTGAFTNYSINSMYRNQNHQIIKYTLYGNVENLGFISGNSLTLYPGINPTVEGLFWAQASDVGTNNNVMAACCTYGLGRIVVVGDSSPADDGTGSPGNDLVSCWGSLTNTNAAFFLAAADWLLGKLNNSQVPNQLWELYED